MKFKAGETYRSFVTGGNGVYKIHILAILDDGYVVFKWYGRHKQRWYRQVASPESLAVSISMTECGK